MTNPTTQRRKTTQQKAAKLYQYEDIYIYIGTITKSLMENGCVTLEKKLKQNLSFHLKSKIHSKHNILG